MAEEVGFEPTETCASHAFQACRFGRSRTPPKFKPPFIAVVAGYRPAINARSGGIVTVFAIM